MNRIQKGVLNAVLGLFLLVGGTQATNPPSRGSFPAGFWNTILQNPAVVTYGDPGWMKRLENRRLLLEKMSRGELPLQKLNADHFVLPILLGQYSDTTGTFTVQDFQNLLFDNNPTGTLTEYYNEISYGQFQVTGTVYGWFTADQGQAYYASDNNGLNANYPQNAKGFVRNIVEKADPTVDFSLYDNDGPDGVPNSGDDDGYVDAVGIVCAGPGPDWYPGNNNIWPHMSNLGSNEYVTNDPSANGGNIIVSTFFICPEEAGGGSGWGVIRPLGVFAHEFGHVLGLPDLYDIDGSSNGIGEWGLMASGSWGGDGAHAETPSHMTAWSKMKLGWLNPSVVTQNVSGLTVRQSETNPEAYLVWEDGYQWSRYFLFENRQKVGFDTYLNGDGLIIYHVDENQQWGPFAWWGGSGNRNELHKLVDVEEADGRADLDNKTNRGDAGDLFPGTSNNRAFTDLSSPNSKDYDGLTTGVEIKNISNSGATMNVDVTVREPLGYVLAYDEGGISGWGWGYSSPQDIWGGVLFQTTLAGTLKAVDAGFREGPTDYELLVYSDFDLTTPSGLLVSVSGQVPSSGWHTIELPGDQAVLGANDNFFVVLRVKNKAYGLSFDKYGVSDHRSYSSGDGVAFSNNIGINGGDLNLRARISADMATSVVPGNRPVPRHFALSQNYPNPFNAGTVIRYQIPARTRVKLSVFNLLGEKVLSLVDAEQDAGEHQVHFQPTSLPSGIYFYRLEAGQFKATQKMILMK